MQVDTQNNVHDAAQQMVVHARRRMIADDANKNGAFEPPPAQDPAKGGAKKGIAMITGGGLSAGDAVTTGGPVMKAPQRLERPEGADRPKVNERPDVNDRRDINTRPDDIEETSRRLEGVFVSSLITRMREASGVQFFGGTPGAQVFEGVFDEMLGDSIARGRGIGLYQQVERALRDREEPEKVHRPLANQGLDYLEM
jgi:hypothetical protein